MGQSSIDSWSRSLKTFSMKGTNLNQGKKISLAELNALSRAKLAAEYSERLAYEATPEGAAERAARETLERRLMEADQRFAEENPPDHFADGKAAAFAGSKREPPDDLEGEAAEQWLAGWDTEGPDDT